MPVFSCSGSVMCPLTAASFDQRRRQGGRGRGLSLMPYPMSCLLLSWECHLPVQVLTSMVHKGDLLRVLPGGKMPSDGVVVCGSSYVDESMLTGKCSVIMFL